MFDNSSFRNNCVIRVTSAFMGKGVLHVLLEPERKKEYKTNHCDCLIPFFRTRLNSSCKIQYVLFVNFKILNNIDFSKNPSYFLNLSVTSSNNVILLSHVNNEVCSYNNFTDKDTL